MICVFGFKLTTNNEFIVDIIYSMSMLPLNILLMSLFNVLDAGSLRRTA